METALLIVIALALADYLLFRRRRRARLRGGRFPNYGE